MNAQAFDAAAAEYDSNFTDQSLGRWLRRSVHRHLMPLLQSGQHILELGCGTGEDAVWLAGRGLYVWATDASPAMLGATRQKAARAGLSERVITAQLDLLELAGNSRTMGRRLLQTTYDGALSNFGALNCLPDRGELAHALSNLIKPGGWLAMVVMGPLCPWEIAWHLTHGQVRRAFRRFRAGAEAHAGAGQRVRVWYPSPRGLRAEFAAHFRAVKTVGVGALLPPPYLGHLLARWPGLFGRLAHWDRRWGARFPWTWLNDHYLAIFERR